MLVYNNKLTDKEVANMDNVTTAEDRAWFAEAVDVQIEQDNRAWLDTMLEMKQDELLKYGVFQYGLPPKAAEAVGRHDLISMIVVANKAGGGQSVSNQTYFYIKEFKGVLEPAVSQFKEDDDPLYLVRGTGAAQQVYDKVNDRWLNLETVKREQAERVAEQRRAANAAAESVSSHPSFDQAQTAPVVVQATPTKPALPILPDGIMDVVANAGLKRADLAKFASELGIDNGSDLEAYPTNKDLIAKITEVNELNKKG